jgi:hypothetical protein
VRWNHNVILICVSCRLRMLDISSWN